MDAARSHTTYMSRVCAATTAAAHLQPAVLPKPAVQCGENERPIRPEANYECCGVGRRRRSEALVQAAVGSRRPQAKIEVGGPVHKAKL